MSCVANSKRDLTPGTLRLLTPEDGLLFLGARVRMPLGGLGQEQRYEPLGLPASGRLELAGTIG